MGRRMSRALSLALFALIGTLALGPASASAAVAPIAPQPYCAKQDSAWYGCNVKVSTLSYYKGWGSVSASCHNPYLAIAYAPDAPRAAWRWTGNGWQRTSLYPGERVYVWPYATGWSWVWTQQTNWVAMQDSNLVVNRYCEWDAQAVGGAGRWGG